MNQNCFKSFQRHVMSPWVLFLVGFVLLSAGVGQAKADFIPAITYSSATTISVGNSCTLGSAFTVGPNNITIDAVGVNIVGFNINNSLTVRIYQDGATTDLVSASVLSSSPNSTTDPRFNYVAITPLVLNAGTKYEIVFDSLEQTNADMFATGITSLPGVTFNHPVSELFRRIGRGGPQSRAAPWHHTNAAAVGARHQSAPVRAPDLYSRSSFASASIASLGRSFIPVCKSATVTPSAFFRSFSASRTSSAVLHPMLAPPGT